MMRNLMILAAVVVLAAAYAVAQDPPAKKTGPCVVWAKETPATHRQHQGRSARAESANPRRAGETSPRQDNIHKLAKHMDDPIQAEILAIAKIKALAEKTDNPEPIVDVLHHLREQSAHPQIQRLALFAIAEVLEDNGQPVEAAETLARVADVRDAPEPRRGRCPMYGPPHGRGGKTMQRSDRDEDEDENDEDHHPSQRRAGRRHHDKDRHEQPQRHRHMRHHRREKMEEEYEEDEDERDEDRDERRRSRRSRQREDDDARLDVPTPDLALSDEDILRLLEASQWMLDDLRRTRVCP